MNPELDTQFFVFSVHTYNSRPKRTKKVHSARALPSRQCFGNNVCSKDSAPKEEVEIIPSLNIYLLLSKLPPGSLIHTFPSPNWLVFWSVPKYSQGHALPPYLYICGSGRDSFIIVLAIGRVLLTQRAIQFTIHFLFFQISTSITMILDTSLLQAPQPMSLLEQLKLKELRFANNTLFRFLNEQCQQINGNSLLQLPTPVETPVLKSVSPMSSNGLASPVSMTPTEFNVPQQPATLLSSTASSPISSPSTSSVDSGVESEDDRRPHQCPDCLKRFRFKSNLFEVCFVEWIDVFNTKILKLNQLLKNKLQKNFNHYCY